MQKLVIGFFLISMTACSSEARRWDSGPGDTAWGEAFAHCTTDGDCSSNLMCDDGMCQMRRCRDNTPSLMALAKTRYFALDRELAVVSNNHIGWYNHDPRLDPLGGSGWNLSSAITSVAGGNFLGTFPEAVAVAFDGGNVLVRSPSGQVSIDVRVAPIAIAGGDLNGDGVDELISIAADGSSSVCAVSENRCKISSIPTFQESFAAIHGIDVTTTDVDGDGVADELLLFNLDKPIPSAFGLTQPQPRIVTFASKATNAAGGSAIIAFGSDGVKYLKIASGDLDGNGTKEVVALKDELSWVPLLGQYIHTYKLDVFRWDPGIKNLLKAFESNTIDAQNVVDIELADFDGDKKDEVGVFRSDGYVDIFKASATAFVSNHAVAIPGASNVSHVGLVDINGNSPVGVLVDGPKRVPGPMTPIAVINLPPYSNTYSKGRSSVRIGAIDSTAQTTTDTFSLSVTTELGFGIGIDLMKLNTELLFSQKGGLLSQTTNAQTLTQAIGERYLAEATPDVYGPKYADVMVGYGCFDVYTYELIDPLQRIGGSGQKFKLFVPVDGSRTLVMPTAHWNAYATAVGGGVPVIDTPYQVGSPESYPAKPERLDGTPIPVNDNVFPNPPTFRVSEAVRDGFVLRESDLQTNESAVQLIDGIGAKAEIALFGVGVEGEFERNQITAHGYRVGIGHDFEIFGTIPPVMDDPRTPEDEPSLHDFSFQPYLYRQPYATSTGVISSYYVLTYTVTPN